MSALPSGTRLGPYEIAAAIGAGGMGEVYRAHDPRLGRDVALKILPESMAKDPEGLARFTREARAVAALNHPHIVTIFSTEEADGVRFMTMELIEGRTLDRVILEGGVSLSQFFDVSMALADALSAAHQKQITHRDLKPANVMVTDAGRVKVLDFGLARGGDGTASGTASLEEQATRQKLTQAGTILGTMPYMSPEQIEAKPLDGRSDIFSLGIVMYEMATGGRPFRGESSPALMSSIMREHPKTASELRPDLPVDVSRLVGKCLEKHPRDRVQTAHEILLELKALRRAWESGASSATGSPKAPAAAEGSATRPSSGPSAPRVRSGSAAASAVNRDYVVAIHPFTSHGSDEESTSLASGLTEDVGTALSRFQILTVRTSKHADARYAVEGSVRRSGNSIRVSARLIDTDTGASVWAENYDRTLGAASFFDLQDEITSRVASTIGSGSGPLLKAMASPLRDRPVAELSLHELVLRSYLYFGSLRLDEHARLRAAFEKALTDQPNHALGWAALSGLYEHEVAWGMNPLPDSVGRCTRAAQRSVEIDPGCQFGWGRLQSASFHTNDVNGMRHAGDRVLALNPLSQNSVGMAGIYFAFRGDWDLGIPVVRRAIEMDPNHLGMLHLALFVDHYRRHDYDEALAQAKRINAIESAIVAFSIASAAGRLARTDEAKAAIEALNRYHSSENAVETGRSRWAYLLRDDELIDRLVEGFEKARALAGREPAAEPRVSGSGPSSGPLTTPVRSGQTASGRTVSIAVLPFTDMSAAKDQDWFCDGIAEEILNALSQLKGLRVAARGSAFSFKGKQEDLQSIGEKLNVGTILEGSVRRAGDRVRITAQLSDVKDGFQLWSERYDREMKDIFDVQDEIAKSIAERLKVTLAGNTDGRLAARPTENIQAYEIYLRGRSLAYKRGRYIVEARREFQRVVDLDPNYALAWAGLADVDSIEGILGMVRPDEARPRALAAARRAIELDPSSSEAHNAFASVLLFYVGDCEGAGREYRKALELNPNNVQARCWYGVFHLQAIEGQLDEGVEQARRALDADPLSAYAKAMVGTAFALAGRTSEALLLVAAAIEADPGAFLAHWSRGAALLWAGRAEEAVEHLQTAVQLGGYCGYSAADLITALAVAGRLSEAQEAHARMTKLAATSYASPASLANAAFALGDWSGAITLARQALDQRDPLLLLQARRWPSMKWLREQPEWPAMLKQLDEPPKIDPD